MKLQRTSWLAGPDRRHGPNVVDRPTLKRWVCSWTLDDWIVLGSGMTLCHNLNNVNIVNSVPPHSNLFIFRALLSTRHCNDDEFERLRSFDSRCCGALTFVLNARALTSIHTAHVPCSHNQYKQTCNKKNACAICSTEPLRHCSIELHHHQ